jgi:carboxylesterase type B
MPSCLLVGTCHGIEIPYVFQAFQFLENVTADEQLSKAISTAWSTFAARGDPNHGGLPVSWPRFNGEERFLTLDLEIVEGANLKDAKCEFFDQLDPPVASSESKLLRLQKAFQKAKSSGKFRTVA